MIMQYAQAIGVQHTLPARITHLCGPPSPQTWHSGSLFSNTSFG